ncbi:G-protein coupled receptor moody-like [Patiria miniata]|uniref:G-protein coupled receptors family 1 profile domain-containing protein n=1 Tax=Patiria miniata TaxID=46514 RepID=A0A913Z135_PATMI|nr:G-protein coupled receptor moody-like [Patiria miniata]
MDDESYYSDGFLRESVVVHNTTEIPPEFEFSDYNQRVVVAVLYLIASVLGIIGNSLVIFAVILSRKLRTTTNAFVVNLSVADLLTSLVIPWDAVELLGKDGQPINAWICSVVAVLQYTTVGCSMYTLASVGLNRLLLITRPATVYRIIDTPRKITVWLVVTWLVPLLIVLVPPLMDIGGVGYNRKYHNCGSKSYHPRSDTYDVIIAGVLYPIPLITIIVCYALIWRHLNRHAKKMLSAPEDPGQTLNNCSSSAPATLSVSVIRSPSAPRQLNRAPTRSQGTVISRSRMNRRQYEITRNMLYVVCAFLLCLTPFAICLFYDNSDPFLPYASAILVFNICVNPLIYATKHRDFKTVFRCILRRKWEDIPEPSDVLKTLRQMKCRSCWTNMRK